MRRALVSAAMVLLLTGMPRAGGAAARNERPQQPQRRQAVFRRGDLRSWRMVQAVATTRAGEPPAQGQKPRILDSPLDIPPALADALDESSLPTRVPELLGVLSARIKEIQQLIASGDLGQAWVPAMATKTVALVLSDRADALPAQNRALALDAARQVIAAAWEVDTYGDLGDRANVSAAVERMSEAAAALEGIYATIQ